MPELFVEYLSEEIPSRMQKGAATYLQKCFELSLAEHKLSFGKISTMFSSRRLVINIEKIPLKQPNIIEELRGPRFGAPKNAIQGFVKSKKMTTQDLFKKDTPKGLFWFLKF